MSKFLGPAPRRKREPSHCPTCGRPVDDQGACPHCPPPFLTDGEVPYPRRRTCPKCNTGLDPVGWCPRCDRRRRTTWAVLLLVAVPAIGLGVCLSPNSPYGLSSVGMFIPCVACTVIPVVLIAYFVDLGLKGDKE